MYLSGGGVAQQQFVLPAHQSNQPFASAVLEETTQTQFRRGSAFQEVRGGRVNNQVLIPLA
jgi:hypothetical protein